MRIIDIDSSWIRLVRLGRRVTRRPALARNRRKHTAAALPVPERLTHSPPPSSD